MSEAPKDGTAILVHTTEAEHGWTIAFWAGPETGGAEEHDKGWYESECSSNSIFGEPLGWLPLPEVQPDS